MSITHRITTVEDRLVRKLSADNCRVEAKLIRERHPESGPGNNTYSLTVTIWSADAPIPLTTTIDLDWAAFDVPAEEVLSLIDDYLFNELAEASALYLKYAPVHSTGIKAASKLDTAAIGNMKNFCVEALDALRRIERVIRAVQRKVIEKAEK